MLEVKSLLRSYELTSSDCLFLWQKEKDSEGTILPLPIREPYRDLLRTVIALRIIELDYPNERNLVVETAFPRKFRSVTSELESIFLTLTGHPIKIHITERVGQGNQSTLTKKPLFERIALISAGLDSMCCAAKVNSGVDGSRIALVHIISDTTTYGNVLRISGSRFFRRNKLFCVNATTKKLKGGISNTRGLLFYVASYAIAASFGIRSFSLGENGSQMLDIMLGQSVYHNSQATMNTNPKFIMRIQHLLSTFDEEEFKIDCTFKNWTRAEMVARFTDRIPWQLSWSCFTRRGKSKMCGICYNCFARHMSLLAAGIGESEKCYEKNPFIPHIQFLSKEDKRKEDIIYYMLDFYSKLLRGHTKAKSEIADLNSGFFEHPMNLAMRFGADIYLGVMRSISQHNQTQLSGLGKKAQKMLNKLPKDILQEREELLNALKK